MILHMTLAIWLKFLFPGFTKNSSSQYTIQAIWETVAATPWDLDTWKFFTLLPNSWWLLLIIPLLLLCWFLLLGSSVFSKGRMKSQWFTKVDKEKYCSTESENPSERWIMHSGRGSAINSKAKAIPQNPPREGPVCPTPVTNGVDLAACRPVVRPRRCWLWVFQTGARGNIGLEQ